MSVKDKIFDRYQEKRGAKMRKYLGIERPSDEAETTASNHQTANFVDVLHQVLGNKVYLTTIEKMFERLELNHEEEQALDMLADDLKNGNSSDKQKDSYKNWKGGF